MEKIKLRGKTVSGGKYGERQKLYDWAYRDRSYASALYDEKEERFHSYLTFKDKETFEQYRKGLRKLARRGLFELTGEKKLTIPTGLDELPPEMREPLYVPTAQRGMAELIKLCDGFLRNGQGADWMRLFAAILSGYSARLLKKHNGKEVPLLSMDRGCVVGLRWAKDLWYGGFEELAGIVRALAVDVSDPRKLEAVQPPVLPCRQAHYVLQDDAFLRIGGKGSYPAQYCDTAVLLHCGFYTVPDVQHFLRRSRWATVLLFDAKDKLRKESMFEIDLTGWNMDLDVDAWGEENISGLMEMYVGWLAERYDDLDVQPVLSSVAAEANELLYQFTAANGSRLTGGRGELACRLVSAVLLFLAFCLNKQVIRPAEYTRLRFEWLNALLPNALASEEVKVPEPPAEAPNRAADTLERLIRPFITEKNAAHFRFCPKEEAAGTKLGADVWGILTTIAPKHDVNMAFKALAIPKERLRQLVGRMPEFAGEDAFNKLWRDITSAVESGEQLTYLHAPMLTRMNLGGKPKSEQALILKIEHEKFPFPEQRDWLLDQFPD